ncbi:hypothetical protein [Brevundimonas mediterranea]|uniref:hypothetical protein n=1 Tax=Brevundimonas mediterranea TaxID=74329 RepID=UPI00403421E4
MRRRHVDFGDGVTLAGRMVAMAVCAGPRFGALAVMRIAGMSIEHLLESGDLGGAGCGIGRRNHGEDGDDQGQRRKNSRQSDYRPRHQGVANGVRQPWQSVIRFALEPTYLVRYLRMNNLRLGKAPAQPVPVFNRADIQIQTAWLCLKPWSDHPQIISGSGY